ncbi:hypothetical protein Droror1_Dr00019813 [Drosera rotundifolia]
MGHFRVGANLNIGKRGRQKKERTSIGTLTDDVVTRSSKERDAMERTNLSTNLGVDDRRVLKRNVRDCGVQTVKLYDDDGNEMSVAMEMRKPLRWVDIVEGEGGDGS